MRRSGAAAELQGTHGRVEHRVVDLVCLQNRREEPQLVLNGVQVLPTYNCDSMAPDTSLWVGVKHSHSSSANTNTIPPD